MLGRIFLMQIAIIFGAYVALLLGVHAAGPLFILVILKTTIDALLHVAVDMRPHPKPAAAAG